jgi:hypothetical protein
MGGKCDEEKNASGWSCFDKTCEGREKLGVGPLEQGERDTRIDNKGHGAEDGTRIVAQNRACAFDGEAACQGQHQGAKRCLQSPDVANDPAIEVTCDPPHATGKLAEDGHPGFGHAPNTTRTLISQICACFSKSGKRTRRSEVLAKQEGGEPMELRCVFEIRMIEGERGCIFNFLFDYGAVARQLLLDKDEMGCDPRAATWLHMVMQFKCAAVMCVTLGQHAANKTFSKTTQPDANLMIDHPDARAQCPSSLAKLQAPLGARAEAEL